MIKNFETFLSSEGLTVASNVKDKIRFGVHTATSEIKQKQEDVEIQY